MAATSPPFQDADQRTITTLPAETPWSSLWWITQAISGIPAESVGWLLSQGWQITNVVPDTSTQPPTPYYSMTRQSLQNMAVLQNLLNSYTTAYNNALEANEVRYNDVVTDWQEMLTSTQAYLETQVTEHNAQVTLYLGNLDTYMTALDALVAANASTLDAAIASSAALLSSSQTTYNAHNTAYLAVLDLLEPDYIQHSAAATEYLTGLGTTELARTREKFAASLSAQIQQLTDSGIYNSTIAADIAARNTRDHNEEIATLNDRLNREKLDNQHKLYEQQVSMRGRIMDGKDRLHALAQEVLRYRQAQTMQDAAAMAEHRNKAIVEKMNIAVTRLHGLENRQADTMKLMAYQLDERNKLMIGLYGFVERREDVGPSFKDLAQVCTALGDSGGGWVTP